ncbi:MAG: MBG domain-containing protein, partial [Prevotellaceae bacterium]|nr:MBG domain-containing protein [Prevotellaceae bacterium]
KHNPVITPSGFTPAETLTYGNCQFDWVASTTYNKDDTGTRSVKFIVSGENPSNARLKWYKNQGEVDCGEFTVAVYVNGESKYSINQDNDETLGSLFAVPLPDLKKGDIVKFEVTKSDATSDGSLTLAACLEYTRTDDNGIPITITADDKDKVIGDDDPELTWTITEGMINEEYPLAATIKISREEGEEVGTYRIIVSQEVGSNPNCKITFVDGKFTITNAIHHNKLDPISSHVGYAQECWEEITTGKFYADAACSQELNPAEVVLYPKLKTNPITTQNSSSPNQDWEFVVAGGPNTYGGYKFNWSAWTHYVYQNEEWQSSLYRGHFDRSVTFTVRDDNVSPTHARLKWFKDNIEPIYGRHLITIYVNGIVVYQIDQINNWINVGGLNAVPLTNLKKGDVIVFEVKRPTSNPGSWNVTTIAAELEYLIGEKKEYTTWGDTQYRIDYDSYQALKEKDLTFKDKDFYDSDYEYEVENGFTYSRDFSNTNWQALYVPFEMSYDDWSENFDVATINNFHEYTNEEGETVKRELEVRYVKHGTLKPNHPYLIRSKKGAALAIKYPINTMMYKPEKNSIVCSSVETKYTFTGTYQEMTGLKTKDYIFMSGGRLSKAENDEIPLSPQRWYLTMEDLGSQISDGTSGSSAKENSFDIKVIDDDNVTGIDEITVSRTPISEYGKQVPARDGLFNLNGIRVNEGYKGIVIKNGKKYYQK